MVMVIGSSWDFSSYSTLDFRLDSEGLHPTEGYTSTMSTCRDMALSQPTDYWISFNFSVCCISSWPLSRPRLISGAFNYYGCCNHRLLHIWFQGLLWKLSFVIPPGWITAMRKSRADVSLRHFSLSFLGVWKLEGRGKGMSSAANGSNVENHHHLFQIKSD